MTGWRELRKLPRAIWLLNLANVINVSEISPPGREGSYMGSYTASFCVCAFLAPLVGTWVLDAGGGQVLWAFNSALALFSAILFLRVRSLKPGIAL